MANIDLSTAIDTYYLPGSEVSREVADLTWRKNPLPPYMVSKNLSVCLWQILTSII